MAGEGLGVTGEPEVIEREESTAYLESIGIPASWCGLTRENGGTADHGDGNESDESKSNQLEHGNDFWGKKRQ